MKTKLWTLFAALLCCVMFAVGVSAATEGDYTYTVTNGKATITDVDTSISGNITIPSTLGGYPVTEIGESAFYSCTEITGVCIPHHIIAIGETAFLNCYNLTYITVENGNHYFTSENGVLFDNKKTTLIQYPAKKTEDSYIVPASVISIEDAAFWRCNNIKAIVILDGVTSIGLGSFYNCNNLSSIVVPCSVTSIGNSAFKNCSNLTIYGHRGCIADNYVHFNEIIREGYCGESLYWVLDIHGNMTIMGDGMMWNWNASDYTAPWEDLRPEILCVKMISGSSISDYAFAGCINLHTVFVGEGVYSVGCNAFDSCFMLEKLQLPLSLQFIDHNAFSDCKKIMYITIPEGVTEIRFGAFSGCSQLLEIVLPKSLTKIGAGVLDLSPNAIIYGYNNSLSQEYATVNNIPFSVIFPIVASGSCGDELTWKLDEVGTLKISGNGEMVYSDWSDYRNSIQKVIIDYGCTSIESMAFSFSGNLQSVTIPNSVVSIGNDAFLSCINLKRVNIPNSVKIIGEYAFYNCYNLTTLTIPSNVTSIGDEAFNLCDALTEITILGKTTYIGENSFYRYPNLTILGKANSTAEAYAKANNIKFVVLPAPTTYTISGKITSSGSGDITIALLQNGTPLEDVVITVDSEAGSYTIANVPAGTYTMRVSKPKHVTREYTVTVGNP